MKKGAMRQKYGPEYRRNYVLPPPPEPAVCTRSEKCEGCPYPGSGFICWGEGGDCMRTRMEKIQERKELYYILQKSEQGFETNITISQ